MSLTDDARNTPLHIAAREGHTGLVRLLLAAGADAAAKNKAGDSPQDLALAFEHDDVVALLVGR